MGNRASTSLRGILRPEAVGTRFALARHAPCESLAHLVERYWCVSWNLPDGVTHLSETLPHPTVNVVFEACGSAVHGIPRARFSRLLEGNGSAFGVKFRPGAFAPFLEGPIHTLTGVSIPVAEVFGDAIRAVDTAILAARTDEDKIALFERFLLARLPPHDEDVDRVVSIITIALEDEALTEVAVLAERVGVQVRTLERLFRRYVGVSPKWVLRRFRIQEAAERAVSSHKLEWAALAASLGYFDQSHFARDFKAQIGTTPKAYSERCAGGA